LAPTLGCIKGDISVDLPYPRNAGDQAVTDTIDEVYRLMTRAQTQQIKKRMELSKSIGLDYRIPDAEVAELLGLLEQVNELQSKGAVDLPDLADEIRLDIDDLFPILEALAIMEFAVVKDGDISITAKGKQWIDADITDKKVIFAKHLISYIPLAKYICESLEQKSNEKRSYPYFHKQLLDHFTEDEATRVLDTVIEWGRYAEIFAFDAGANQLSLEEADRIG